MHKLKLLFISVFIFAVPKISCSTCKRKESSSVLDMEFVRERLKLAITLLLFVVSFALSCLPWSFALVFCRKSMECILKTDEDYTLVLVLLHTIVLPIIYGLRVDSVKRCVIGFCTKLFNMLTCRASRDFTLPKQ